MGVAVLWARGYVGERSGTERGKGGLRDVPVHVHLRCCMDCAPPVAVVSVRHPIHHESGLVACGCSSVECSLCALLVLVLRGKTYTVRDRVLESAPPEPALQFLTSVTATTQ